jgi:diadenosine tetraphosphatase ApaH/serine/threonine PP2A family protein phosphatase
VVKGNHDYYCSVNTPLNGFNPLAANVIHWTRNQLSAEERGYLEQLPYKRRVDNYTIVHSTLDMPEKWGYVFDRFEADANFTYQRTAVCFFGHTHVPLAFERNETNDVIQGRYSTIDIVPGKKYFVNVGSVGQPRDGDPRAAYAIFDLDKREIELRRLKYDIETTQQKILNAGLPEELAYRLQAGH